ncbi:ABC transporter ATP-binding protein [Rossellomorea vietnamensis]
MLQLTQKEGDVLGVQGETVLSIRELQKSFGSKHVLKGIDLEVQKGQIIGYIGPNGAGKSTTVKILLGLETADRGEIEVFGEKISDSNIDYKRKIGYVPEIAEIYDNLTANEYMTFIGELYGMTAEEAGDKAFKLMNIFGLEGVFHSKIASYSKGMKQKVLIISSLLHDPELLFFDEPINGLDANSVMVFKEILAKLAAEGKTIFYSSHIMDVVEKISSRIILLHDGRIVADGTFAELKGQNMDGTLEQIFNELTGFNEHGQIAERFVEIVKGGV